MSENPTSTPSRSTDDRPVVRDLPHGYDDERSPFYVKPEHRDVYRVVEPDQRERDEATRAACSHEMRQQDLAVWNAERDRRKATRPRDSFEDWFRRQTGQRYETNPEALPTSRALSMTNDIPLRGASYVHQLSDEGQRLAEHLAVRELAQRHAEATQRRALREVQLRQLLTCTTCGSYPARGLTEGGRSGVCLSCSELEHMLLLATEHVPAGGNRLQVVAASAGLDLAGLAALGQRSRWGRRQPM